ncbi:MAG: carbohydrate ABC transporter permease [Treponema sp.]|jgi:multiple sugar transport system permease protein|nr:carbohydrate ABC transporter permease [Treponema sp.]
MYNSAIKKVQNQKTALVYRAVKVAFMYGALVFFAYVMVLPFLWMLSTALKERQDVFKVPIQWIPDPVMWSNFIDIFNVVRLDEGYLNSFKIAIPATVGTLLTCAMAGYGFSKLHFRGQNIFFGLLMVTMMIPGQVTLIPMYLIFKQFGWINTYLPLVVPAILCNAFGVFMFRQFFFSIPDSLIEAAKIDGSSPPGVFFRIVLPQSKGIFATMGLFSFMGSWNAFLGPLIYLNKPAKYTLPLMMALFRSTTGQSSTQWPQLMAISCIAVVPVLILYAATQKYYVRSIVITGMKN